MEISIESEIKSKVPQVQLGVVQFKAENTQLNEVLWNEISSLQHQLQTEMEVAQISQLPAIQNGRKAYKALGKDPARYRLSAEALMRRTLKGINLYQINTMVDFINYLSLKTGMSIGGYDESNIDGKMFLSIGKNDDDYNAVGRGKLNIENLPVLRDEIGAFGSPTSDSVRTSISIDSNFFVLVFFDFQGQSDLASILKQILVEAKQFFTLSESKIAIIQ